VIIEQGLHAVTRYQHIGPPPFPDTGPTEGGHQTARAGRYFEGIGRQLRPQHSHHAPRDEGRMKIGRALGGKKTGYSPESRPPGL